MTDTAYKEFRGSYPIIDNNTIQSYQSEHTIQVLQSPRNSTLTNPFQLKQLQLGRESRDGSVIGQNQNQEMRPHNNSTQYNQKILEYDYQNVEYVQPPQINSFTNKQEDKKINGLFQKNVIVIGKNELKYNISIIKPYNPFLVPPDWATAQRHAEATRVGMDRKPKKKQLATYEICPCCDNQIEKQSLSLFDDPIKLLFLGSGYPLYFDFIKQCIYIIIVILLISGCYNLSTNIKGKECLVNNKHTVTGEELPYSQQKCHYDIISKFTYINKHIDIEYIYYQDILDYFTVLALIFMFIFFRKQQIDKDIECDGLDLTPSDYTVMIKNIPKNIRPNVLKSFLQDLVPPSKILQSKLNEEHDDDGSATQGESDKIEKIEVTDINYVYMKNHSQVEKLEGAIKRYQKKAKRFNITQSDQAIQSQISMLRGNSILQNQGNSLILNQVTFGNQQPNQITEIIDQDYLALEKILSDIDRDPKNFNSYAFVSFMSDKQRDQVLSCAIDKSTQASFSSYLCSTFTSNTLEEFKDLDFEGHTLQICKAPEPLEIIWDNIMTDDKKKSSKRLHSFLYTVISLVLYTIVIYYLNYDNGDNDNDNLPIKKKSTDINIDDNNSFLQNFNSTYLFNGTSVENNLNDISQYHPMQQEKDHHNFSKYKSNKSNVEHHHKQKLVSQQNFQVESQNKNRNENNHAEKKTQFLSKKSQNTDQNNFKQNNSKREIPHIIYEEQKEDKSQNKQKYENYADIDNIEDEVNPIIQLVKDQFSNLTVSIVMILLNSLVVRYAFEFIVNNECYNTFSLYKINMAQKLSIALFISNALVTTFITIVYSHNIYGNGGLIYIMIFYLALDTPFNCFIEFIDFWGYVKKTKRYWHQRKGESCTLNQQQANEMCEMPVHEIEICYAEIINTMYISVFYSPILPIGIILSLIGLILFYWAQKYSIIYKRTVKQQVSIKLSQEMTNSLEIIVAIYPISNTIFHFISSGDITMLQVISILFGIIYIIIPSELLIKSIFKFKDTEQEEQSYPVAYPRFKTTYARLNPVTAEIANSKHYEMFNNTANNASFLTNNVNNKNNQNNGSLRSF